MESRERFVLHDQMSDRNCLGDGIFRNLAIPLTHDLVPGQALVQLFQDNPHHNARAFERRLTAANPGIRNDVPPEFDSAVLSVGFRFHANETDFALGPIELQPSAGERRC